MALIKPILNSNFKFGSTTLLGTRTIFLDPEITQGFNAILQFFSQSDVFIGDIRLDNDNSNFLQLDITENKVGVESEIDLESLFNAVVNNRQSINRLFVDDWIR